MKFRWSLAHAFALATLAAGSAAQEKPEPAEKAEKADKSEKAAPAPTKPPYQGATVQRLIQIKNVDIIQELRSLAKGFGPVAVYTSQELGVMVLTGEPAAVAAAQQAVERFDVPRSRKAPAVPRNADLTAYLVLAKSDGEPTRLPEALTPVIEQLKGVFPYKRYELIETVALRARHDGAASTSGALPWTATSAKMFYTLGLYGVHIKDAETTTVVTVGQVQLTIQVPLTSEPDPAEPKEVQYRTAEIKTGFDIREGQKIVVGKVSPDGTNSSLLLVMTAKVAE
jgi:hypothetical protein